MKPFQLNIPTKIYFGRNILEEAIKKCDKFIRGNVIIVTTGRSLIRLGYLDMLKEILMQLPKVKDVVVFQEISANPKLSEVKRGVSFGKQKKINCVIGFGGGSALDAAKAIAAGIGTENDIEVLFRKGLEPSNATLPIVAIPTTAGTGSELSKAAILTDDEQKKKGGLRGESLYPTVAIVDSAFTESIPFRVTMETGFDVLAHALESYLSKAASPYTEMQSEYVIGIVGEYLPKLAENLKDADAREKMSFASMIMGINLGNASTCLPHRMQYPVGAYTNTSHGAGLAAMYLSWLEIEYDYSAEKVKKAVELLTGEMCDSKNKILAVMKNFLTKLCLPVSLKDLGVTEDMISDMAADVTGNIQNDPAAVENDVIRKIYVHALQGEK